MCDLEVMLGLFCLMPNAWRVEWTY
jgi:hypothetical protein